MPAAFAGRLREAVKRGDFELLAAREDGEPAGVALLAYRLNVSAAGYFASLEELYVPEGFRLRGVGRALLEAVGERCRARGVSYVEVQVECESAAAFYSALGFEPESATRVFSRSYEL